MIFKISMLIKGETGQEQLVEKTSKRVLMLLIVAVSSILSDDEVAGYVLQTHLLGSDSY